MIFDKIYIDRDGQLHHRKEEDSIIKDAEWAAAWESEQLEEQNKLIEELDRAIEEYIREYGDIFSFDNL